MANNKVIEDFNNLGISVQLTEEGSKTLAKILADGCPVKFNLHYPMAINCSLHWAGGYNNCEQCWKNYLKRFIVKESTK